MPRIQALDPNQSSGKTRALFDDVKAKFGKVPNLMATVGQAPAALEGYLNFAGALAGGALSHQMRELISVAVAETNGCEYCLSAHVAGGRAAKLTQAQIDAGRDASSADPKVDTALRFARGIVINLGHVDDTELEQVRAAGWTDEEIVEIVANVGLNIFTNYFNLIAGTEVDFPQVRIGEFASAAR